MSQSQHIRIAATTDLISALDMLKVQRYPLLSYAEIIKVVVSEFVSQETQNQKIKRLKAFRDVQGLTSPLGEKFLESKGLDKADLTEDQLYDLIAND